MPAHLKQCLEHALAFLATTDEAECPACFYAGLAETAEREAETCRQIQASTHAGPPAVRDGLERGRGLASEEVDDEVHAT